MISKELCIKCLKELGTCPIRDDSIGADRQFMTDDDGQIYEVSHLSDGQAADLIQRSKEAGRNLFFEECPTVTIDDDPETDY